MEWVWHCSAVLQCVFNRTVSWSAALLRLCKYLNSMLKAAIYLFLRESACSCRLRTVFTSLSSLISASVSLARICCACCSRQQTVQEMVLMMDYYTLSMAHLHGVLAVEGR